ncbi:hypothetical protein [Sphingobacterium sp.]|uniref:hypothetical protein n=1 Tax=Sphingobacterium sp. TaxID=341027 RepID=UPI00289F6B46|nr:hypothetical protein [Sphingobacterium sp.]
MEGKKHQLFDKRQSKPRIINDIGEGMDYTIVQTKDIRYGKSTIHYWPPNISSIFLNSSKKHFEIACNIHKIEIKPLESQSKTIELSIDQTCQLYDYIENMQIAIIMLSTAIECIINSIIPSNYIYKTKYKYEKKEYGYLDIQRYISLIEKIKCIIPDALKVSEVHKQKFWSKFKRLIVLRNNLIHMKSKETSSNYDQRNYFEDLDNHIIQTLVDGETISLVNSGFDLIKFLQKEIPQKHDFPILYETENLEIERVDDIRNYFKHV